MGYGDNEPPAIRADPLPATLDHANRFKMLILTFVKWDVIKLRWSLEGGSPGYLEIDGGPHGVTDYTFEPAQPSGRYTFTAQGCDRGDYCSPESEPYVAVAAKNTNSVRQFLQSSGIDLSKAVSLPSLLRSRGNRTSLRNVMGL